MNTDREEIAVLSDLLIAIHGEPRLDPIQESRVQYRERVGIPLRFSEEAMSKRKKRLQVSSIYRLCLRRQARNSAWGFLRNSR